MRRVLMVQPSLQPPGGGAGVAAWMLQAMCREHHVTVLSWRPVDVDPINRFFGTELRQCDFQTIVVPRSWAFVPDHLPVPAALVRSGLLMRYTRRVSAAFDVVVGAHNEADYGRRGIQYVNYPTYYRPRPEVDLRWYHRSGTILKMYYALADWIADVSFERLKSNLTLANSDWTALHVRRFLGTDARTLYPPVVAAEQLVPWGSRTNGFLMLGRISPEKEIERAMRILARVRRSVPDLTLTVVGTRDRHVARYDRRLRTLAASLGGWIQFRHDLSRDEVRDLMIGQRYGIHGMRQEHFGMAPAEMVSAGMIVWVANGGGQVEIVGGEPALTYDSEEQAADTIARVLTNAAEQQRLRDHLAVRSKLFGTDRFMNEVRQVIADFKE